MKVDGGNQTAEQELNIINKIIELDGMIPDDSKFPSLTKKGPNKESTAQGIMKNDNDQDRQCKSQMGTACGRCHIF